MTPEQTRELLKAARAVIDVFMYTGDPIDPELDRVLYGLQDVVEEIDISEAEDDE